MALSTSKYNLTFNDNTVKTDTGKPETGTVSFDITTLTTVNYAAVAANLVSLIAAIEAIDIGVTAKTALIWEETIVSDLPAASLAAQREVKLKLRYHDAVVPAWKYSRSIPCFDLTTLPDHSELLDLSTGVGAALKSAFEAVVVSHNDDSHAVVLDSAQYVGANS